MQPEVPEQKTKMALFFRFEEGFDVADHLQVISQTASYVPAHWKLTTAERRHIVTAFEQSYNYAGECIEFAFSASMSTNQVKRWQLILNGLASKLEGTEWDIDADKGMKPRCVLACGGLEQDVVKAAAAYRERLDANVGANPESIHSAPRM